MDSSNKLLDLYSFSMMNLNNEILLTLDMPVIQALVICYIRDLNWVQMYTTRPYISHVMIEF